jgi:hypothetical protein
VSRARISIVILSDCLDAEYLQDVEIDIERLREMHPRLSAHNAPLLVKRAALALERNGHTSGVCVSWNLEDAVVNDVFLWPKTDLSEIDGHDQHRITEDGAEAVALALAHNHKGWRVLRRMQRDEYGDWLLEHGDEKRPELVALEISGVGRGSIRTRVSRKLEQVAKSRHVHQRWVGVVGFEKPTATFRSTEPNENGN